MRIGIIGCGNIVPQYLKHSRAYEFLDIEALADLDIKRAQARVEEFGLGRACSVDELLDDPDIELVVNLTIPASHYEVAMAALQAGKHVYNEKPLAATVQQARALLEEARGRNLRVGGAPDTFLGSGHQTARKAVDDGLIGRPVAGTAFMLCPGHESWHPAPQFYYREGGGPMLDMGPYYLTALINMLGPVRRVMGMTGIQIPERTLGAGPDAGSKLTVEVPDHVAGLLEFEQGAMVTIVTSFAVIASQHPPITLFGTTASLGVPDPNGFDGKVTLCRERRGTWEELPVAHAVGYGRMSGVADLAQAILNDRPARASGELAFEALRIMRAFYESWESGKVVELESDLRRPLPMPETEQLGRFD
ncbi:MAG: Gfo/Idh/MocA family oxidoreductase [Phycisphaeraceae bacterium]|nr:Gfo/Idh/MocA family oxidoreductase [Phycisphaeraceae bacterium]